jgi:phenylacetate-CoA ligase
VYPRILRADDHVLDILRTLPILSKRTVREHNANLCATPPLSLTKYHTTSGTSGTPLRLPATLREKWHSEAILRDWYRTLTGEPAPRTIVLSGFMTPDPTSRELFWKDYATGRYYLSIYSLKDEHRRRLRDILRMVEPKVIYGYASAVYQLARVLEGMDDPHRHDRVAVVTSEVLQPDWRNLMEHVLCRRVFNLYGSQEGSHVVMQCVHGGMHIHPRSGIVEVLDNDNRPVASGMMGRVVVTGLSKRSMPLIRYELGDSVQSLGYAAGCACGLRWPMIGGVEGRSEDLVTTADGRQIGMLGYSVLKLLPGVKESQLVQRGFSRFQCNIVRDRQSVANETIEYIVRSELKRRVSADVEVDFSYLAAIPRGANGKFKAVGVAFDERDGGRAH